MKPQTRSFYEEMVQRTIERIATQLDEALGLATLAAEAGLSPFHFHRIFRGMVGETPVELMRRLRMERAAWMLIQTDTPVTEIAFNAGYETHEAFTRSFRAWYGTSPTGFRRRAHPRIELACTCGVHFHPAGHVPAFIPSDSGGRTMQVEIIERPELRVGTIRHVGPYNQIPRAFERLGAIAGRAGLFAQPEAAMVALYHDDPESTPHDQLRSDAAIVVGGATALPSELVEQRIPAGRYARTTHVGPYERLGDAWLRLMGEWLPASGYRLGAGVSYEMYVSDPATVAPEERRTDLYIPIE